MSSRGFARESVESIESIGSVESMKAGGGTHDVRPESPIFGPFSLSHHHGAELRHLPNTKLRKKRLKIKIHTLDLDLVLQPEFHV